MMRITSAHIFFFALAIGFAAAALAGDWPSRRGPNGDGTSRERNLPEKWSPAGENLLWSNKIGGICTPIVMKGRVYVTTRVGEEQVDGQLFAGPRTQEALVCIDAETGKPLWEYRQPPAGSPVTFEDLGAGGATGDPETGRVYALFSDMSLVCLEGTDAKVVWKRQLAEELGAAADLPGDCTMFNGMVLIRPQTVFDLAMRRSFSFDARNGGVLKRPPDALDFAMGMNAVKPSAYSVGGTVYSLMGGVLAASAKDDPGEKWNATVSPRHHNSPVWADGRLYLAVPDGVFSVLKLDESGVQVLSRVELRERPGRSMAIGGSPAIANGRIYLQASAGMYCIGIKNQKVVEDPAPPRSGDASEDNHFRYEAWLLPSDLLVRGGEQSKLEIHVLGLDRRPPRVPTSRPSVSRYLARVLYPTTMPTTRRAQSPPTQPVQLDSELGTIASGPTITFTAAAASTPIAGEIVAELFGPGVDGMKAKSFVRMFPALPWNLSCEHEPIGSTPAIFVGTPLTVTEHNGRKLLARKAGPTFTYFGLPDMSNYSIQANVMLSRGAAANQLPPGEAGVINSRFILSLAPDNRQLRIHTWPGGLPRGQVKSADYRWDAESWHTLKLTVETTPDKAVVRGKAWPAGSPEPQAWNIELEDTTYTRGGCPGLFGQTTSATILYDKISVTAIGK